MTESVEPVEITEPEKISEPLTPLKKKKTRTMTPELLEKLKMARERATELRLEAKKIKGELPPPTSIPDDVEKTKVAKYLATRKYIKEQIKKDIINEPEIISEPSGINKNSKKVKNTNPDESSSDSESEDFVIRVPKKKLIKYQKKVTEKNEKGRQEQVYGSGYDINRFGTNHLIGLCRGGYQF